MNLSERFLAVVNTLNGLDQRKKIALAAGLLISLTAAVLIGVTLNKPATHPLYMNLTREDLNSMARVLSENGIEFTSVAERGSIEVRPQSVAKSRMLLAEHGLPSSQESGYELFDRMNTIGLTSFMQDVTNKRAIEGELVRTIQMISGISSARVHLVMPEQNVYRRNLGGAPTGAVVLKTMGRLQSKSISAIRHMVASAVPGLEVENVTIVDADGTLLTSRDEGLLGGTNRLVELERQFEREAAAKISAAIGAHLGGDNYRVSVTAKLNSDKRRLDETVFDPESRVERSVQVVRETGSSQNSETSESTSVEQNLPDAGPDLSASGQSSTENNERREELTNYEINRKQISVVSDGYSVEQLSVALVVNEGRIQQLLGEGADEAAREAKVSELEAIVRSAISASEDRGDRVTVSLVEFMDFAPASAPGGQSFMSFFSLHAGAMINAAGLVIAAILFALLGIRPLLAFLSRQQAARQGADTMLPQRRADAGTASPSARAAALPSAATSVAPAGAGTPSVFEQAVSQEAQIRDQLENIVEQGEERAAMAIRQWLKEDSMQTAGN